MQKKNILSWSYVRSVRQLTIYFRVIDPSIHFSKNRLAPLIKSLQTINILVDHLNSGNVCNQYSCLWGPYVSCKWGVSKNGSKSELLKVNHWVFKGSEGEGLYLQSHQFPSQRDGPVASVTLVSQSPPLPLPNQVVSRGA